MMAAPVGDLSIFSKMSLRSFWGMRFGVDLCGGDRRDEAQSDQPRDAYIIHTWARSFPSLISICSIPPFGRNRCTGPSPVRPRSKASAHHSRRTPAPRQNLLPTLTPNRAASRGSTAPDPGVCPQGAGNHLSKYARHRFVIGVQTCMYCGDIAPLLRPMNPRKVQRRQAGLQSH